MAWARAFYALAHGLKPGDRIVTGVIEYGANYVAMLQVIQMAWAKNTTGCSYGSIVVALLS